jgi:hypothetical protein
MRLAFHFDTRFSLLVLCLAWSFRHSHNFDILLWMSVLGAFFISRQLECRGRGRCGARRFEPMYKIYVFTNTREPHSCHFRLSPFGSPDQLLRERISGASHSTLSSSIPLQLMVGPCSTLPGTCPSFSMRLLRVRHSMYLISSSGACHPASVSRARKVRLTVSYPLHIFDRRRFWICLMR